MSTETGLAPFEEAFARRVPEGVASTFTLGVESIRAHLVQPVADPFGMALTTAQRAARVPLLDASETNPLLYTILEHGHGFLDVYWAAFLLNNGIAAVDHLQSRITKRNIPDQISTSTALLISVGAATVYESWITHSAQLIDPTTLPGIALGALAYAGIHHIGMKYVPRLGRTTTSVTA